MLSKKFTLPIVTLGLLLPISYFLPPVNAADSVQMDIQNVQVENKKSTSPTITPTPINRSLSPILKKDYVLEQSNRASATVKVSSNLLLFSDIDPTNPQLRQSTISLQTDSNQPTILEIYMTQPLQTTDGQAVIPATTCDNGGCTTTSSDIWKHTLTYGFGYTCDDCKEEFSDPTAYMALPLGRENARKLLTSDGIKDNSHTNLTFKLNIAATQAQSTYSSQIVYLALPQL